MREEDRAAAASMITEIVTHTAAAYGCEGTVCLTPGEPVLVNDPELAAGAAQRLDRIGVPAEVSFRSYGADDFSYYCQSGRGLMLFVGLGADDGTGLHHESFLPDDTTIAPGRRRPPGGILGRRGPLKEEPHPRGLRRRGPALAALEPGRPRWDIRDRPCCQADPSNHLPAR